MTRRTSTVLAAAALWLTTSASPVNPVSVDYGSRDPGFGIITESAGPSRLQPTVTTAKPAADPLSFLKEDEKIPISSKQVELPRRGFQELKVLPTPVTAVSGRTPKAITAPETIGIPKAGDYIAKDFLLTGAEENAVMTISQSAMGYTVENVYGLGQSVNMAVNVATGKVSIQPQLIYDHPTYGDLYMYPIEIAADGTIQYFPSSPITGTVTENGDITLGSWAIIGKEGAYNGRLILAFGSSQWIPSNGNLTAINSKGEDVNLPILVEQPAADMLRIYNMASNGVGVNVRIDAYKNLTISPQYILTVALYGEFYCYSVNAAGQVNTAEPILGKMAGSRLSFNPWCVGARMSPGTTALYFRNTKISTSMTFIVPDKIEPDFEGSGTASDPYLIKTANDMAALSQTTNAGNAYANVFFRLANDIDMSAVPGQWVPIGSSTTMFKGHFDGAGHTLTNFRINTSGYSFQGVFGVLAENASVENLTMTGVEMTGQGDYIGAICGYSFGSITNCHVSGSLTYKGKMVGGLTGRSYAPITDCTFSGNISAWGYAGGISGYHFHTMRNCHSDGNISIDGVLNSSHVCVGGLIGLAQSYSTARESVIENCYFSGTVRQTTGQGFAGGITGYLYASRMEGCFNVGAVSSTGTSEKQGSGGISGTVNEVEITNCYNAGPVSDSGTSTYVGGLIGYLNCTYTGMQGITGPSHISGSYNSGQVTGRLRTVHSGIFGDEYTIPQFEEKPSDEAFVNVYTDNQATGLEDTRFGHNTDFFTASLPAGMTASAWSVTNGQYPVLKVSAATDESKVSAAVIQFPVGQSTRILRTSATVKAVSPVQWSLLDNGVPSSTAVGLKLAGNTLSLTGEYANDTIVAFIPGQPMTRRYVINAVPAQFEGQGTAESPYLIRNAADLKRLHNAVMHFDHRNIHFLQTADIDLEYASDFQGVGAGNHILEFAGVYDGGGFAIHRLKVRAYHINASGQTLVGTYNYGGLFHIGSETSVIKNVTIADDCDFEFYNYSAPVIGYTRGRVENCRNFANVPVGTSNIAGIVGRTEESAVVTGCYNAGTITGDTYVGGVVGYSLGDGSFCQNDGAINSARGYAGGVLGVCAGNTDNCLNNGTVIATKYVGGIIGSNSAGNGKGSVTNCISTGMVTLVGTESTVGALIGYSNGAGTVANNYYEASINVGAGCSSLKTGINAAYTYTLTSGTAPEGFSAQGWTFTKGLYPSLTPFAQTDASIAMRSIYLNFGQGQIRTNITSPVPLSPSSKIVWTLQEGTAFTITDGILNVKVPESDIASDKLTATYGKYTKTYELMSLPNILDGKGTASSPFLIRTVADLTRLATFMASSGMEYKGYFFRLENDITYGSDDEFIPIGSAKVNFNGTFDGGGHTIAGYNYTNTATTASYTGFFWGIGSDALVKNLTINGKHKGRSNTGGLTGRLYGTIRDCVVKGTVESSATGYTGGFAAEMYEGSQIVRCEFQGQVNTAAQTTRLSNLGGFAAEIDYGATVDSCVNRGKIGYVLENNSNGSTYVGGIAARCNGLISNSSNQGEIMGFGFMAGICPNLLKTGTITGCFNLMDIYTQAGTVSGIAGTNTAGGTASIINCYNKGNITGTTSVGGVLANGTAGITVENCYNEGAISGVSDVCFQVGGVIGNSSAGTVRNCYNIGEVYGSSQSTGGFAGKLGTSIVTDCFNLGAVTVSRDTEHNQSGVGGFCGSMCGEFERVWNAGNVSVTNVPGVGGLVGAGAMPVAKIRDSFNLGNVTVNQIRIENQNNAGCGGIWGGYGPVIIENCYNSGTLSGPDYVAGINGAMHSNSNGSSIIRNCYNNGSLISTDPNATHLAEISNIGDGADTLSMKTVNCYYLQGINAGFVADSASTGLSANQLMAKQISDNYVVRRACFPTLASMQTNEYANLASAWIELAQGDALNNINQPFYLGLPSGIEWTCSDNIRINDEGCCSSLLVDNGWVQASTTTLEEPRIKRIELYLAKVFNISQMDGDAPLLRREYYDISGLRVAHPVPGQIYIVRSIYADGVIKISKSVIPRP